MVVKKHEQPNNPYIVKSTKQNQANLRKKAPFIAAAGSSKKNKKQSTKKIMIMKNIYSVMQIN